VIPFLHLGSLEIPTFGLMVALAMVGAFYLLRADMARRDIAKKDSSTAEMFIVVPSLAGIAGAKLYHVLETPRELFAHPLDLLLSRYGLAWFGGLIGGFAAWVLLARMKKIPLLDSFDAGSAAAALGYGIGRIGCLLSGDGDYGVPTSLPWGMSFPNGLVPTTDTCVQQGWPANCRVHPTPIYEFVVACLIAWILWKLGAAQLASLKSRGAFVAARPGRSRGAGFGPASSSAEKSARISARSPKSQLEAPSAKRRDNSPDTDEHAMVNERAQAFPRTLASGSVFAAYLILTGIARFLVEFIRINPRSFFGMSNAQAASLASILAGIILWWRLSRRSVHPANP